MSKFDQIIQRATEKLYEDERLRSHLSDDEAKVVLGWAENWIQSQVLSAKDETVATQIAQGEFARVRQSVSVMNTLAAKPGAINLVEAVTAIQPAVQAQSALSREHVFELLTEFVSALWKMQAESRKIVTSPRPNTPT